MTAAKASQIICYSLITASEAFMPTVVCVCSRRILANFSPFQDSFTPPRCVLCCVLGAFRFQEVRLSRRMRMRRRRRRRKGLWSLSRVIRTRMYVLCMLWRPKAVQVILFSLGKACDTWCFYLIGRVFGLFVCFPVWLKILVVGHKTSPVLDVSIGEPGVGFAVFNDFEVIADLETDRFLRKQSVCFH